MRYTRLRRQIESGSLIGTHGTTFASTTASEKEPKRNSKRVRGSRKAFGEGTEAEVTVDVEPAHKVKKEDSDIDSLEGGSENTDPWSSEDEIPLSKLRKAKLGIMPDENEDHTERIGAPIPELGQVSGPVVQERGASDMRHVIHSERSMFAPGLPMHLYTEVTEQSRLSMPSPLPPFSETFGPPLQGQYHNEWSQFEGPRIGWDSESMQGCSSWIPNKLI
jgi:hypothetical protein